MDCGEHCQAAGAIERRRSGDRLRRRLRLVVFAPRASPPLLAMAQYVKVRSRINAGLRNFHREMFLDFLDEDF